LNNADAPGSPRTARDWLATLNHYRSPTPLRSLFEILVTAIPFALLWAAMWVSLHWSYLLSLAIAVPAGGFLVRLFMIQHDCGHGSFFRRRWANDWAGRAMSVLTFTPYDHWRRSHAVHHGSSGNLDRRGIGDITTLTVAEYLARPRWRRLAYRIYRHPLVLFAIGPAYLFLVQHRFPSGDAEKGWRSWLSPMATNAAMALLAVAIIWLVGVQAFVLVQLPIILLAASMGVWCFTSSTSSRTRSGPMRKPGRCMRPRCMAVHITICRLSCAGSPPISASITYIISAAAFPTIAYPAFLAIIPSSRMSAVSRSAKALPVCA
jgi:omega-6 fatty acid desaturase (delta-12 desaturase)